MFFAGYNRHGAMLDEISAAELVERAAAGDKEAYRGLVERYQKKAYAIAFEITRSKEDAEDVVQEAFVKAYLSLPDFRRQSSFYTWLYRIVYNMAIDLKRKLRRRGGEADEFDETKTGQWASEGAMSENRFSSPQELVIQKERAAQVQKVMQDISEEHRAVFVLREFEGMSYDEMSRVLGVSKGTVMSRLFYARKKLQQNLQDLVPSIREGEVSVEGNSSNESDSDSGVAVSVQSCVK